MNLLVVATALLSTTLFAATRAQWPHFAAMFRWCARPQP